MVDFTQFSNEDLLALKDNNFQGMSDEALLMLRDASQQPQQQSSLFSSSPEPEPEDEGGVLSFLGDSARSIASGAIGEVGRELYGSSFTLPEEAEQASRGGIRNLEESIQNVVRPEREGVWNTLMEGVGSTTPYLVAPAIGALAGPPGIAVGALISVLMGVASGAGEGGMRAEDAGATEEQISRAAGFGMAPGALEAFTPARIVNRAYRIFKGVPAKTVTKITDDLRGRVANKLSKFASETRTGRIAESALSEAVQEATSETLQNMIAQNIYDPTAGMFTGVPESAGYGGGVGAIIAGLTEIIFPGRNRGGGGGGGDTGATDTTGEPLQPTTPTTPGETGDLFGEPNAELTQPINEDEYLDSSSIIMRDLQQLGIELDTKTAKDLYGLDLTDPAQQEQAKTILSRYIANKGVQTFKPEVVANVRNYLNGPRFAPVAGESQITEQPDLIDIAETQQAEELIDAEQDPEIEALEVEEQQARADVLGAVVNDPNLTTVNDMTDAFAAGVESQGWTNILPTEEEILSMEAAVLDAQDTQTEQAADTDRRRNILLPILETEDANENVLADEFSAALSQQGFVDTVPSAEELRLIQRAVDTRAAIDTQESSDLLASVVPEKGAKAQRQQEVAERVPGATRDMFGGRGQIQPTEEPEAVQTPTSTERQMDMFFADPEQTGVQMDMFGALPAENVGQGETVEAAVDDAIQNNKRFIRSPWGYLAVSIDQEGQITEQTDLVDEVNRLENEDILYDGKETPLARDTRKALQQERRNQEIKDNLARNKANRQWVPGLQPGPMAESALSEDSVDDLTWMRNPISQESIFNVVKGKRLEPSDIEAITEVKKTNYTKGQYLSGYKAKNNLEPNQKRLAQENAAAFYFNNIDAKSAIRIIAAETIQRRGDNAQRARAAKDWINANLSETAQAFFEGEVAEYTALKEKTTNQDTSIYDSSALQKRYEKGLADFEADIERPANAQEAASILAEAETEQKKIKDDLKRDEEFKEAQRDTLDFAASENVDPKALIEEDVDGTEDEDARIADLEDIAQTTKKAKDATAKSLAEKNKPASVAAEAILEAKEQGEELLNKDGKPLKLSAVAEWAREVSEAAMIKLRAGDIRGALYAMNTTSTQLAARTATRLAGLIDPNTKVNFVSQLYNDKGEPLAGIYDYRTRVITLNTSVPIVDHTVMHEVSHAILDATSKKKSHPVTKQLEKIYTDFKNAFGESTEYAYTNLDEFLAEAVNNHTFQAKLSKYTPQGTKLNLWRRFRNAVAQLLGFKQTESAFSEINTLLNGLLAPTVSEADVTLVNDAINNDEVGKLIQEKFGADLSSQDVGRVEDALNKIEGTTEGMSVASARGLLNVLGLQNIQQLVEGWLPSVKKLYRHITAYDGTRNEYSEQTTATVKQIDKAFDIGLTTTGKRTPENAEKKKLANSLLDAGREFRIKAWLTRAEAKKEYTDPEKFAKYEIMRAQWNKLDPAQQKALRTIIDAYAAVNQTIVNGLKSFVDMSTLSKDMRAGVMDKILLRILQENENAIEPFVPHDRQGEHWAEWEMFTGEVDAAGSPVQRYWTRPYMSYAERIKAKNDLKNNPNYVPNSFQNRTQTQILKNLRNQKVPIQFLADMSKEFQKGINVPIKGADGKTTVKNVKVPEKITGMIEQAIIENMPEWALMMGAGKVKGTPGYNTDHIEVFKRRMPALQNTATNLKHNARLKQIIKEIEAEAPPLKERTRWQKEVLRALIGTQSETDETLGKIPSFAEFIKDPTLHPYARKARAATFVWTLGFNLSGAAVNGINPYLTGLPVLAGQYRKYGGMVAAMSATHAAASSYMQSGTKHNQKLLATLDTDSGKVEQDSVVVTEGRGLTNVYDVDPKNLTPKQRKDQRTDKWLHEALIKNGMASRTRVQDWIDGVFDSGAAVQNIMNMSGYLQNHSERWSRHVVAKATYMLEMEKLSDLDGNRTKLADMTDAQLEKYGPEAAQVAIDTTDYVNSAAFIASGSRIGQTNLGSLAAMYKRFPAQQAFVQFRILGALTKLIRGNAKTEQEREIAKDLAHSGAWMIGTSGILAGLAGVPLYGVVSSIADMLFWDEDEDDFDTIMAKNLPNWVFEGALAGNWNIFSDKYLFPNISISNRISLTNLLIPDAGNYRPENPWANRFEKLAGPVYGVGTRVVRGTNTWLFDEEGVNTTFRGIEQMMPSGIANVMKAYRANTEGYRTMRDDIILEDPSLVSNISQAFGFTPADFAAIQEQSAAIRRIDNAVADERQRITNRFFLSWYFSDDELRDEVIEETYDFNQRHPEVAIMPTTFVTSISQRERNSSIADRLQGVVLRNPRRFGRVESFLDEYGWDDTD